MYALPPHDAELRPTYQPRLSRVTRWALATALLVLSLTSVTAGAQPALATAPSRDLATVEAATSPLLTLGHTTGITEYGNGPAEAVVGEAVSYTARLTLPAQTTVFDAVVATPLPTGLTYLSSSAAFSSDGALPVVGALPPGVSLNPSNGALRFGSAYANNTASAQLFQVTVRARVATTPVTNQGVSRPTTSTLRANAGPGGAALPPITATSTVVVVVPSPWLRVSDDDIDGLVVAGQRITFTLRADNVVGRPDAHDGWFVTCVPAGLTFSAFVTGPTSATTSPGTGANGCQQAQTRIAWDVADVSDAGEVLSYTASVEEDAQAGIRYTTSAVLTGSTLRDGKADPAAADNPLERTFVRTELHTLIGTGTSADLSIGQELTGGTVVPGSSATYTLTVDNSGPSESSGPIVVTDELASGVELVSASGSGWSCVSEATTVTCSRAGGLPVGEVAPAVTLTIDVPSDREDPVTNVASVDGPDPDPVADNDQTTLTTEVSGSADLSIEKRLVGTVVAGDTAAYRLTVHNEGPSDAQAVEVADELPAELRFVDATSVGGSWTCSEVGGVVSCDLDGSLVSGQDAVVNVEVDVAAAHTGNVVNEAVVDSATSDPNPVNNHDTDDSANEVRANLSVDVTHPGVVRAGESVAYAVVVANDGPSDSSGPLVVTDVLPAGLTLVSADGIGWSCDDAEGVVTCTRNAGLAAGATAPSIAVTAVVASDAGPATVANVASVDGPDNDPDPGDNSDVDSTEIIDAANITVTKALVADDSAYAGSTASFVISVHNQGPSDADAVSVIDVLPPGMTLLSASGDGWTCDDEATPTCTRDTLEAGADEQITVHVQLASGVAAGTVLTNGASATTATAGNDPADDASEADVVVETSADLAVTVAHDGGAAAGTQVTFDVNITNDGPSDAPNPVTVVDTLPLGFAFRDNDGPWLCEAEQPDGESGETVTCTLPAGVVARTDAQQLSLTAEVASSVDAGIHTNVVRVSSDATDPNPGNNAATDDVEVYTSAAVSIALSHRAAARVGDPLPSEISVVNGGPSDARGVHVTEVLPTGLEFISASGTDWSCSAVQAEVTCTHQGPLAPGSAPVITLIARVLPSAYPSVTQSATVASTTDDPSESDNTATDEVEVPPLADLEMTKRHPQALRTARNGSYRVSVTNNGPTVDPGPVTVVDVLPPGLVYVAADSVPFDCDVVGQTVTCIDPDGLAVDERDGIVLIVTVALPAGTQVDNSASVTSTTQDPDLSNNAATDPAIVQP
jgi:uncharacterized repeat protein (TIGR01451 family)